MSDKKEQFIPSEEEYFLQDFSLSFIQAILKSSYYAPDHPGSTKAKEGLFKKLKNVLGENRELTYFIKNLTSGDEAVFVEYPPYESFSLEKLLKSERGKTFIPKYLSYFERKKLALVTFRNETGDQEFKNFIDVMAEHVEGAAKMTSASLAEYFANKGIEHITLVFEDEVVGTRRKLPWKVQLALSRLRKDLKMIPLFKDKTEEEIRYTKRMVLADIIRPFKEAHLASRLLANIDLAYHGVEQYISENLEEEIIRLLPEVIIPELSLELVDLLKKAGELKESEEVRVIIDNIKKSMGFVVGRLVKEHPEEVEIFEQMLEQGVIDQKDLPEIARRYIHGKKITLKRLKNWDKFLEEIRSSDIEEFVKIGNEILSMSQILEEKKAFEEIASLSGVLKKKADEALPANPACYHIAQNVLKAFAQQGGVVKSISHLIGQYQEGALDREKATEIIKGFAALGEISIPPLLDILKKSPSKTVRKVIVDVLSQSTENTAILLLRELKKPGLPWYFKRNLILILGNLKASIARDTIKNFLRDPEARVREEALIALSKSDEKDFHLHLNTALKDQSSEVRSRALLLLGSLKKVTPDIYRSALENLKDEENSISSKKVALKIFEKWGNKKFPDGKTVEEVLIELIEHSFGGLFKRLKESQEEELIKEVLRLLIEIGGKKSHLFIRKNFKKFPSALQQFITQAKEKFGLKI